MVYQVNIFMYAFSILLLVLLESSFQSGENSSEQKSLRSVFHICYIYYVLEIAWNVLDGRDIPFGITINYVICTLAAISVSLLGYKWFCYYERLTNPKKSFSIVHNILTIIPLIVFIGLCLSTFYTKWLFYIDDNNFYETGTRFWIYILCGYFYIFLAVIFALISLRKKVTTDQKKRYIIISSYSLIPILTLIFKFFDSSNLTIIQLGIALSLTCVYVNIQQQKITRDGLTMLNNRSALEKFMDEKVLCYPEEREELNLILIDINNFRNINKSYGHVVGDITICNIAEILKTACGNKKCFLARYSGDVFAICCTKMNTEDVLLFTQSIKNKLDKMEKYKDLELSYVIQSQPYEVNFRNIKEWINTLLKKISKEKHQLEKNTESQETK